MDIKQVDLREMELSSINTADYNPRKDLKPEDKEYQRLKNSILTYGMVDPLIYNEKSGRLVGGHQRYKVLRDLGVEKAQVSVVHLNDKQEKDLNIRLNNVHGEFERDSLIEVVQELWAEDFDLDNLGFDEEDFNDLIGGEQEPPTYDYSPTYEGSDNERKEPEREEYTPPAYDAFTDTRSVDTSVPVSHYEDDPTYEAEKYQPTAEVEFNDYFNISFPVNYEQREIIENAIKEAKAEFKVDTHSEALLKIANTYLVRVKLQEKGMKVIANESV